jgi:hypothetical protein
LRFCRRLNFLKLVVGQPQHLHILLSQHLPVVNSEMPEAHAPPPAGRILPARRAPRSRSERFHIPIQHGQPLGGVDAGARISRSATSTGALSHWRFSVARPGLSAGVFELPQFGFTTDAVLATVLRALPAPT